MSHSVSTTFDEDDAMRIVLELMRSSQRPTAIVLANDSMAIAAIAALQRAGFSVPGDVSIVGHDDLPLGRWTYPSLTTISQDLLGLGAAAAHRLLEILGVALEGEPITVRPPQLVVRGSTAPPPAAVR